MSELVVSNFAGCGVFESHRKFETASPASNFPARSPTRGSLRVAALVGWFDVEATVVELRAQATSVKSAADSGSNNGDGNRRMRRHEKGCSADSNQWRRLLNAGSSCKGDTSNLSVSDGGNGSAVPVLFVHSFAGSAAQWQPQLDHLRSTRRAVAFDLRAHGQSDASSNNDYFIRAFADDIGVVADQLELGHFVLVGHSMGGATAIAYAGAHPDRVAGLVVEGIGGKMDDKMAKLMLEALDADVEQQMPEYWKRLLANASPTTEALVKHDRAVQTKVPGLEVKIIDGTSHWTQLDQAGEFNRILDEFLLELPA